MAKLGDLASLIRSKNAGPFVLTFDIMFDEKEAYERVRASGRVTAATFAKLYSVPESEILFFYVDNALAVKASIPRPYIQGDVADADTHGGQQFGPLVEIEI